MEDRSAETNILCPVCGTHRFAERDDYAICPVCGWENDALQYDEPDYEGGANVESLNQYREEWKTRAAQRGIK